MADELMTTINIVGAGRVGRTLAALWQQHGVFTIGAVGNRTVDSAREAVAFIGAGTVAGALAGMPAADAWLLATPDRDIAPVAASLGASGLLRANDVVFHCSGALASDVLRATLSTAVAVASVHPLKTFADPRAAMRSFAGTFCAAEGDSAALHLLLPAFERIGARVSTIDTSAKTLYHAASVMVCNALTALMEAGLQCYGKAGFSRDTAGAMMEPLVRETVDNVFSLGTVRALTGPIARGDHEVVARQLAALQLSEPDLAAVYRALGRVAVALSAVQGGTDETALAQLRRILA